MSDDEDVPSLSAETFAALKEFYNDQDNREAQMKAAAEMAANSDVSDLNFDEDWQLSQFWYDDSTARAYAEECIRLAGEEGSIACISSPTLYLAIKKHFPNTKCKVTLFEYDRRFGVFGPDFCFYDYKSPLDVPRESRESYDVVLADPPFLSEECLTKTAVTVKFLAKEKIILCTGAIMTELAERLLNVKCCKFLPKHKNNLANEFRCFANYDLDAHVKNES